MLDPLTFVFLLTALLLGHGAGDVLAQAHTVATAKTLPGKAGAAACRAHVLSYTATQAAIAVVCCALAGIHPHPALAVAGLALSGVTHYIIDRGPVLAWIAEATGSAAFVEDRFGRFLYDQVLHGLALAAAAALMSLGTVS